MTAILKAEAAALSETNTKISPQLERLVRRCLEKRPERRFQTASDLGFALESLSGVSGARMPEAASAPAPIKRRLSPVLAGIGFALLVMGAVAGIFAGKPFWKTPTPSYQRLTFNRGTIWNARFAPDGQSVVYSARWNGSPVRWRLDIKSETTPSGKSYSVFQLREQVWSAGTCPRFGSLWQRAEAAPDYPSGARSQHLVPRERLAAT
jgi:hypothetical protein